MVRLKSRYLLVQILYPEMAQSSSALTSKTSPHLSSPSLLTFHRPTSPSLTPKLFLRLVRDALAKVFGEYGAGVAGAGVVGTST